LLFQRFESGDPDGFSDGAGTKSDCAYYQVFLIPNRRPQWRVENVLFIENLLAYTFYLYTYQGKQVNENPKNYFILTSIKNALCVNLSINATNMNAEEISGANGFQ